MFGLGQPSANWIAAAIVILPAALISLAVVVVAVIGVISPTRAMRMHSLRVLSSLTEYGRMLRTRP